MKKLVGFFITLVLCFFAIRPLFGTGYFPMHDDTQVARVVVMGKALREGQFPVRWVSDLGYGYGYPIYNFYGPLPYYFGGGLYGLGVDSMIATKTMFAVGALLAAVFFYLFASSIFDPIVGTVGSLLFMYAPYHAVQIYVRGAVGEYWAIAFVPLLLWGLFETFKEKKRYFGIVAGGLGLAGIILSHTILGFVTVGSTIVGLLIYAFIQIWKKSKNVVSIGNLFLIFLLGLGLSAFFWLPAFVEMHATSVSAMIQHEPAGFFDNFVCLGQLWDSPWGFGGSAPGCVDGLSFKLGKAQLLLALVGIIGWFVCRKKKPVLEAGFLGLGAMIFILSAFAVVDISKPIWQLVPFVTFIQYPWRLLAFTALGMGMCGGFILTILRKPTGKIIGAFFIVGICLYMNAKLFVPQYQYSRPSSAFETPQDLRYRVSKISDEYLPPDIVKPQNPNDYVKTPVIGNTTLAVTITTLKDTLFVVNLESKLKQWVIIQQAYFPGWVYFINGTKITPTIVHGLPHVLVLEGQSTLVARLTNTPIRLAGNIISLISVLFIGGIIIYGKKTIA